MTDTIRILFKLEFHECDFAINMLFPIDFDLFMGACI